MMNREYALYKCIKMTLLLSACVMMSGCAALGYRLGTTLPPDVRSIFIPTFVNGTKEPQIEIRSTALTIQEFRKDGSLRIADAEHADTRLEVKLLTYELVALRYEQDRAKAGSEYRMTIRASIVLTAVSTSKIMAQSNVSGDTTFILSGDMAAAKAKALPFAARDLAHDIVESVVEFW